MRKKKNKHNKNVLSATSNFNTVEKDKSKALRDNEISHINLTRIMNEEKKYYKPKECIGMIKSQRSDIESNNQAENGKRLAIDEVI